MEELEDAEGNRDTPRALPARVGRAQRVLKGIGVAVERLRVARPGHNRIRLHEQTHQRLVETRLISGLL